MSLSMNIHTTNTNVDSSWSLRSKWYHFLFWGGYFIFWLMVTSNAPFLENVAFNLVFLSFNILAVYSILYYLMPKYLYVRRYFLFTILAVAMVLLSSALLGLSLYLLHMLLNIEHGAFFKFPTILGPTLGSVGTSVIFLMIAKLVKNNITSEQKNESLEIEKVENELKFLKSQLNPHFLFNALNNIYFLIKKDPDTAAESLAKFSDMIRYQLYECNEDKILLSQEIDYIKNYIKISSLGKSESTDIKVNIQEGLEELKITPLILVPLVENAFKHIGENDQGENYIDIDISMNENLLTCKTINSIGKKDLNKPDKKTIAQAKDSGLGLQNLQRRLSLLYPNNHEYKIVNEKGSYASTLEINL